MISHEVLRWLHVVTFALWFGTDLGVFAASRIVTTPTARIEARRSALGLLLALDLVPRLAMLGVVAIAPLLAAPYAGWAPPALVQWGWLAVVVAWGAVVVRLHAAAPGSAPRLRRVDLGLRIALIAVCAWIALRTVPSSLPWLAAKLLLLATAVACGLGVRRTLAPFMAAFGELVALGASAQVEASMASSMRRTRGLVLAIYVCVLAAAWLGIARPPWP